MMQALKASQSNLKLSLFSGKGSLSPFTNKGSVDDENQDNETPKVRRQSLAEHPEETIGDGNSVSSPSGQQAKPKSWFSSRPFRGSSKDHAHEEINDQSHGGTVASVDKQSGEGAEKFVIALLGPSGSGKSSFIAHATGQNVKIGHFLTACTDSIDAFELTLPNNKNVLFLDTPGYDLADKNPNRVLNMLTSWLKVQAASGKKINLNAILFFHRITDNRMPVATLSHINKFEKLFSKKGAPARILLVTTMWDEVDEYMGSKREEQLQREFWKRLMEGGSSIHRFERSRSSAWAFLNPLVGGNVENVPLPSVLDHGLTEEPEEEMEFDPEQALRAMEQIVNDQQRLMHKLQLIIQQPPAEQTGALKEVLAEEKKVSGKLGSLLTRLKGYNRRGISGFWRNGATQHD